MRYYYLTASIITLIVLSACAEGPGNEVEAVSTPELSTSQSSQSEPLQQDRAAMQKRPLTKITNISDSGFAALSKRYEGLDPRDISQAEIDEMISLQKEQSQFSQAYQEQLKVWYNQDPAIRGQQPKMVQSPRALEINERMQVLNGKFYIASSRKRYKELDPKDISEAEIDELVTLQQEQYLIGQEFQKEIMAWHAQDPSIRGTQPQMPSSPRSEEINERLQELNSRVQIATLRKQYENLDPQVISKDEVEELIALQQEQMKVGSERQKTMQAWYKQDPATRGAQPEITMPPVNPRLQELQSKIRSANQIKAIKERTQKLSATHNVSLSDSEINQLTELEIEKQKLQNDISKVFMEAQKKGQPISAENYQASIMNAVPKHVIQRMFEVDQQIKAIKAPLESVEKADRIRKNLTQLSEQSGLPILSNEIEEAIALNAEKDRIQNKAQTDAYNKWVTEGTPLSNVRPLPNDADYARLKEIDARLKEIRAPLNEAKNAALEANNPALRQRRLEQEKRQKWTEDWQDKKQSGEIPWDAPMHSPTYAEVQDQVKDYRTKLKARADKAGYTVSEANLDRLDALNEEMVDIRKKVYDTEVDGTAMVTQGYGKSPSFALTSDMYKVRLIETKRREILTDLSKAEASQFSSAQNRESQIGTQPYAYGLAHTAGGSAEMLIESFRKRDIEVSQSEADDLLAFERAMQDK